MTDQEILERIGLSPEELREFFQKLNQFIRSLKQKEREVFLGSLKPIQAAADEAAKVDKEITADRLEKLMRNHASPDDVLTICCACLQRPPEPPPSKK